MRTFVLGCLTSTLICSATFAYLQNGQLVAYLFVGILAQALVGVVGLGVLVYGYVASLFRSDEGEREKERLVA